MKKSKFYFIFYSGSIFAVLFVFIPILSIVLKPKISELYSALKDSAVLNSLYLSIYASFIAALISVIIGTPLSYILSRKNFYGKKLIEGIIDLPLMIPHPVIGLALLSVIAKEHVIGKLLYKLSIEIVGSINGIVLVMVYVGLPFYINTLKSGILSIPERLEHISKTLGKSDFQTFFRVTLPLSKGSIVEGLIMSMARAISEFGAIIVIAYHPMVAPVLIYERFTAYGLKYSSPVAVLLIVISLILFILLRVISRKREKKVL